MSTSSSIVDLLISYKFIQMLSTPWKQMPAYKLGIIDETGRILRPRATLVTPEEKRAYPSTFYTLVWNIKKLIEFNSPCLLGKGINMVNRPEVAIRTLLLREWARAEGSDGTVVEDLVMEELGRRGYDPRALLEQSHAVPIEPGTYLIRGRRITLESQLLPTDEFFGFPIYRVDGMPFTLDEVVREDAPANAVGHGNIAGVSPGQEPPGRKGLMFTRRKKKTDPFRR